MSEELKALKEKLFARKKTIEIEGVRFVIRRLTKREVVDQLAPFMERLQNTKAENLTELTKAAIEWEKKLIELCVVEPKLDPDFDTWLDPEVWQKLVREIQEFNFLVSKEKTSRGQRQPIPAIS